MTAFYIAPADGRIRVPASAAELTVQTLCCEPLPLREEFAADGQRWVVFPAGIAVRIEARLRCHAHGDQPPTALPFLLPGAHTIEPWPLPPTTEPPTVH